MADLNWDEILSEEKKSKNEAIEKVNKKIVEKTYKESIVADENLTTLRIKIHLLSKDGEWVEVGTFAFSKENFANITDFVRDIILSQIDDLSRFNIGGIAKVKYVVYDENSSKALLRNTVSIAIPKELLREKLEEKKEEVIVKTEASVWDSIEKFVELNKALLDNTIRMKDMEKEQVEKLFELQLRELNKKIEEIKSKAPEGGEKALVLLTELQRLRDEFERRLIELKAKNPMEEVATKVVEKVVDKALDKAFKEEDRKDSDELAKYLLTLLKNENQTQVELLKTLLHKELDKDPTNEIEKIARLVKELRDKDTGEDIKNELSKIVLEIAKRKMSEDPLEDLKQKVELINGIVKTLRGDESKIKEEIQQQINELRNLILTQQMSYPQYEEEPKDPLEQLESETEKLARIYERMEKLFGKREPASKTLIETIKEVLSSPTIVEIAKTLVQGLIQMQQLQMQMQMQAVTNPLYMQAVAYGQMPVRKRVVKKKAVVSPQQSQPQQISQVKMPGPQPQPQPVAVPQTTASGTEKQVEEHSVLKQAEDLFHKELAPVLKELAKEKKRGKEWEEKVINTMTEKLLKLEQEKQLMARIVTENQDDLAKFKEFIDEEVKNLLKVSKQKAVELSDAVLARVVQKLIG